MVQFFVSTIFICKLVAAINASTRTMTNVTTIFGNKPLKSNPVFPEKCGLLPTTDRIIGGDEPAIGAYPFMTLIGYTLSNSKQQYFFCGGTLITNRFVLTASHCTELGKYKLEFVRFGEHNLTSELDCISYGDFKECAEPHLDVLVEKIYKHPQYDMDTVKNDIALLKTIKSVDFTVYIQPICLPFSEKYKKANLEEKQFFVAGWGKTDYRNQEGSPVLQYAIVFVKRHAFCNSVVPKEVRDLSDSQICANGETQQDACKGDSGGPLFTIALENEGTFKGIPRAYQIGVVSFASTAKCGTTSVPPVYTRVDRYLEWIMDTVSKNTVII